MKIAILGCGAMGSVYAALLGDAGHEVWAIDSWLDHVDAIKQGGLKGQGMGEGTLKDSVPEAHTDYIIAVINAYVL